MRLDTMLNTSNQTDTLSSDFNVLTAPTTLSSVIWQKVLTLVTRNPKSRNRRMGVGFGEQLEARQYLSGASADVNETSEQLLARATTIALYGTDEQKNAFLTELDAMDIARQEALLQGLETTLASTSSSLNDATAALAALPPPGTLPWTADSMHWNAAENPELSGKIAKTGVWVYSVGMTPDGSKVIVADGNRVKAINAATGTELWSTSANHGASTVQAQLSPDGTKIVTRGYDRCVTLLDTTNGTILWSTQMGQVANNLAWSPDQTKILVSDYDGTMWTIDAATGALTQVLSNPNYWHAEYGTDSLMMSNNKTVEIRDPQTLAIRSTLQSPMMMHDLVEQPSGNLIAATGSPNAPNDGRIIFWDKTTQAQVAIANTGAERVWKVEFSSNGKIFAASTNNAGVFLYSVNGTTVTLVKQIQGMGETSDIAFSSDGSTLLIATQKGTYFYKTPDAARTAYMAPESPEAAPLRSEIDVLSHQKTTLEEMTASIGDLIAEEQAAPIMGPELPEAINSSEQEFSNVMLDQTVLEFLENQRQENESLGNRTWGERLMFADGVVSSMAVSPGGDRIAVAKNDGSVRFLIAATGEETGDRLTFPELVKYTAYLPNGNLVLVSGNMLTLVNNMGVTLKTIDEGAPIESMRVLPNGSFMVTLAVPPTVLLYSSDGTEILRKQLPSNAGAINVTDDGKTVSYRAPNGIVVEPLAEGGAQFSMDFTNLFYRSGLVGSASDIGEAGGRFVFAVAGGNQNISLMATDMHGTVVAQPYNLGMERELLSITGVGGNNFLVDIRTYNPLGRQAKLFSLRMDAFVEVQSTGFLERWRDAPLSLSPDGRTVLTGGQDTLQATDLPQDVADAGALRAGAFKIGHAIVTDGRLDNPEGRQLAAGQRADLLMLAAMQGDACNYRYTDERVLQKFLAVNPGWRQENMAQTMASEHLSENNYWYARNAAFESYRICIGAYEDAVGRMMEAGMDALLADTKGGDPTAPLAGLRKLLTDTHGDPSFIRLSQIGICSPTETDIFNACRAILIHCADEYEDMQRLYQNRTSNAVNRMASGSYAGSGEASAPTRNDPSLSRAAIRAAMYVLSQKTNRVLVTEASPVDDIFIDGIRIQTLAAKTQERLHGASTNNSATLEAGVKVLEAPVLDAGNDTSRIIELAPNGSVYVRFVLRKPMMMNAWVNMQEVGSIQGGLVAQGKPNIDLSLLGSNLPETYHSNKSQESGESISSMLPAGTYYLEVMDSTSYASLTPQEKLAIDLPSLPVHLEFKPYNTANIEGKISVEGRDAAIDVSMRVANFGADNKRNTKYDMNPNEGGVYKLDPARPVWVVIHGMNSSENSGSIDELLKVMTQNPEFAAMQIVSVDWKDAARDMTKTGQDAIWTPAVGKWIANRLLGVGFQPNQINGVGHSHGTFVLDAIGKELMQKTGGAQMRTLIALDPAGHIPGASTFDSSSINFSGVSLHSVALDSSLGVGSDHLSESADTAFKVVSSETEWPPTEHSLAIAAFRNILSGNIATRTVAQKHFGISKLMTPIESNLDLYEDNQFSGGFEGKIFLRNVQPQAGIDGTWYTADALSVEYKRKDSTQLTSEFF